MSELQSQRLWKPARTNRTRNKRESASITIAEGTHKPRPTSGRRRRDYHSPGGRTSKSHFSSYHGQHEQWPPTGHHVFQSLSSHSIPKPTPRAHTSLGFTGQGSPHSSYNHHQLKSQSSRQISSHPHTSSRKSLRAHSSLGFTWQGPTHQSYDYHDLQAPQGYDIARYVQQQGVGSVIHIGVNGRECQDEYLLAYLKECRKQALLEDGEEEVWSDEEDDVIMMSSERDVGLVSDVPLCWDDQLKKAEPITITNSTPSDCNTLRNHPTVTRSRHTPRNTVSTLDSHDNKKRDIIIHDLLQQADIISVMVTWGRSTCLLESTSLEELRDGRMAYIPQPELVVQEDSDGWSGVSMATVNPQGEGKRVDTAEDNVWLTGRSDSVGDLVQSLLKLAPDFGSKNLLCVWFGATEAEIKEFSTLDFDVFLTSNSTQVFSKVKAVNISDKRAVIPLSMEGRELLFADGGRRMTLCVMCGSLRSILFTVRLKQPPPSSSLTLQENPTAPLDHGEQIIDSARFFKRRSYVSPDEDEDKTDMQALVKFFPDLMLLDLVEHETTPPFLSPVHQHVERLNSMVTTSKEEPLLLNSQTNQQRVEAHSADTHEGEPLSSTSFIAMQHMSEPLSSTTSVTTQKTSEPLSSTSSMATLKMSESLSSTVTVPTSEPTSCHRLQYTHSQRTNRRPLYRPKQEHGSTRKSFVSITKHWLGPYV